MPLAPTYRPTRLGAQSHGSAAQSSEATFDIAPPTVAEAQWPALEPPQRTLADREFGDDVDGEAYEPREPAFTDEPSAPREANLAAQVAEAVYADKSHSRTASLSAGDDEAADFDDDDFDDEFDDDFEEDDDEFGADDDVAGDDPGEDTEFTTFGEDDEEELPVEPDEE